MPDEKLHYFDFAKKVKSKYPQYADVDDRELAQKMVDKFPEYKDQVSFDESDPLKKKRKYGFSIRISIFFGRWHFKFGRHIGISESPPAASGPINLTAD